MAIDGSAVQIVSLLSVFLLAQPCFSATQNAYFSDFESCDTTYSIGRDDKVIVAAKRITSSSSTGFTDCSILFKADSIDDRLCVKINKLTFSRSSLKLQYFDFLDPTTGAATQEFTDSTGLPTEICSSGREASLKLTKIETDAKIDDIVIDIIVVNMQGSQRIAHMDEDCPVTYNMDDSTIHVLNRNSAGAGDLESICQVRFKYVGSVNNKTICLQYNEVNRNCNYELLVLDGSASGGQTPKQTYKCDVSTPQTWCSDEKEIELQLTIKGSAPLPASVFGVTVKDGYKDGDNFPTPSPEPEPFPTWAIAVIVIAVIAVVAAVGVVIYCKKAKGMGNHEKVDIGGSKI